ncbi:plasmid recombination protein [Sphingomonas sanguinis]|uniref:plasmid recombination protein n=1 Tax=Sphingomonas sp. LC-1 TaxID=3110957 RepID=UPI0021BB5560|nr:plasmid recombination protein [Sphingomonas sp. LC-1]MCT8000539.1 plasmid recombination protein [Sphingomonas sp. LC-1]
MTDQPYTIMRTHRITSWSHAYWVGQHNSRDMDTPNADPSAMPPRHLIGTGDARADLQAAHERFKPKMTADAVLGLEFIFTASPQFFDRLSPSSRVSVAYQMANLAREYLEERYPHEGQITSLVMHLDERVFHGHAVVMPVHLRVDGRTGEREYYRDDEGKRRWRVKRPESREPEWMLSADRDMGGKAQLSIHQDQWAKMVEHLGLRRGRHRSGAVHKTNKEHAADLDAAIAAAGVERDELVRERSAVAVEATRQRDDAAALAEKRTALDAERSAHAKAVAAERTALAALRAAIDADRAKLDERAEKAREWLLRARQRAKELNGLELQERAIAKREARVEEDRAKLDERATVIADLADAARLALAHIDTAWLPADLRPRIYAVATDFGLALHEAARVDPNARLVSRTPISASRPV